MILIDQRIGSKELLPYIQRIGCYCELDLMDFGDACFEGNGPNGSKITIGIERKSLSDMLNCIDDSRYSARQRPGMRMMYDKDILIMEGVYKPDIVSGMMMECVRALTWLPYRYRSQMVPYAKLFRYLLSVELAGTTVIHSRDLEHTAFNICECFKYYQKKWEDHTSQLDTERLAIPDLRGKLKLVRKWAASIDAVGVKRSLEAEKLFKTPFDLANATEVDWMRVSGISYKSAKKIVDAIHGIE